MRKLRIFSVLILAVMILAACAPAGGSDAGDDASSASAGEIKVGVLVPLSGQVSTFGVSTRDGILLAVNQWNEKGGVNGMKIVPIIEDGQCTPDPAVNAANKVIDQDGVHYILGEVCSKAVIPVSEIASAKGVLMITPTGTADVITVNPDGTAKPYVYRACFNDSFQGAVGAAFAFDNLGAKKAFLMTDQANDYVKGLSETFKATWLEKGGEIVGEASYTSKDTDFSAIIAQIKDANPDVVYLPDYYNIVNLVMKQAKEAGLNIPFVGGDGWDSSDLDLAAADGGYFTNHYSPDIQSPEVTKFLADYGAAYKDDTGNPKVPDALAALGYDGANMLFTAIQTAGVDDVDKVAEALDNIELVGVSGTITIDEFHNPVKDLTILAVKDGKVNFETVVKP